MENINKFIKFLLENALFSENYNSNDDLIQEVMTSMNDPEFKPMEQYYTRGVASADLYGKLTDKDKLIGINIVNKIVNGGTLNKLMVYPEDKSLSVLDNFITTTLATEYVSDSVDSSINWSPENKNSNNILQFLNIFFNPYSKSKHENKNLVARKVAKAAVKFITGEKDEDEIEIDGEKYSLSKEQSMKITEKDVDIDIIIDSYYKAIDYLLVKKKYDGSSPFDSFLTQFKWPQLIGDFFKRKEERDRRTKTIRPYISEPDSDDELGIEDLYGKEDKPVDTFKVNQIFNYINSKLNDEGKKVFEAWMKWFESEFGSSNEEIISKVADDSASAEELDAIDKASSEQELQNISDRMFMRKIGEYLGLDTSQRNDYENLKVKLSRTRNQIKELTKNKKFLQFLGLESQARKGFDILRFGMKAKRKTIEEPEESSEENEKLDETLLENSVKNIFEYLEFNLNNINKQIYRFNSVKNIIKESNDTDVADLGKDISNFTGYAINGLEDAMNNINELQNIARYIQKEFPQISDKILNYCEPFEDKIFNIVQDLKRINIELKPYFKDNFLSSSEYLGESNSKKKNFLDEDDLDEERITNPESKDFVKNRENFIGSHIYGEDLGGLGKMYVSYSYGEQFPAYLWFKDKWYHNSDDYILDDGTVNEPTNQHKNDMRPVQDTHGLSTYAMNNMIKRFKKKYGLGDNIHTDVEPGEKN